MTPGENIIPKTPMLVDDVDLTETMHAGEGRLSTDSR